jgi:hypothetical protein
MAVVKITGEFQTWDYDKYMEKDGHISKNRSSCNQDIRSLRGWF